MARDTTINNMLGGRSTGHFGTGTYFVSKPDPDSGRGDSRPVYKIDFSKYNLYKPENASMGDLLHKELRRINELMGSNHTASERNVITGEWKNKPADYKGISERLESNFGIKVTPDKIKSIINDVDKEIEGNPYAAKGKTPSTRVMEKAGYEGIDVRHISELDTHSYGSVIYDLNKAQG